MFVRREGGLETMIVEDSSKTGSGENCGQFATMSLQRKNNDHRMEQKLNNYNNNNNNNNINNHHQYSTANYIKLTHQRKQFSSFILFISVIIFVNLCPFHPELELFSNNNDHVDQIISSSSNYKLQNQQTRGSQMVESVDKSYLENCLNFMKIVFTNPIDFNKQKGRTMKSFQAEARVIGKMAKMWYIKKKIKKLSKKLKKHTIAVPVFTAIPIYEHSYYPQPHVTHVSHGGLHHAAASSYAPALSTAATVAAASQAVAASQAAAAAGQQMATSASSNHQQMVHPYRQMGNAAHQHHHHHPGGYGPMATAGAHQIINGYAPSPPLYVDESGGLYGHYGNAYGRYDGGYQMW